MQLGGKSVVPLSSLGRSLPSSRRNSPTCRGRESPAGRCPAKNTSNGSTYSSICGKILCGGDVGPLSSRAESEQLSCTSAEDFVREVVMVERWSKLEPTGLPGPSEGQIRFWEYRRGCSLILYSVHAMSEQLSSTSAEEFVYVVVVVVVGTRGSNLENLRHHYVEWAILVIR